MLQLWADTHPPPTVFIGERGSHLENILPIGGHLPVVLETLEPPPRSVAAVVARIGSAAQEIGNETVTHAGSKRQDVVPAMTTY